jgi:glycosyltransferase involved in cell wall biosynthesis
MTSTLFINNYPTPYRRELFDALTSDPRLSNVTILHATHPQRKRLAIGWPKSPSGPKQTTYANDIAVVLPFSARRLVVPIQVTVEVIRHRPEIIVCTLSRDMLLVQIMCASVAWFTSSKLVFWIGDVLPSENQSFLLRQLDAVRAALALRANGLIFYSEKSKEWLRSVASTKSKAKCFWTGGQVRAPETITASRPKHATHRPLRILFVGGDDPRKGYTQLVSDLRSLAPMFSRRLKLISVGTRKQRIIDHPTLAEVHIGSVHHSEMKKLYSLVDVVIIASLKDPWGFVFNEATAVLTPCIVSRHAGASTVAAGAGLDYLPGEASTLAVALDRALSIDYEQLHRISEILSVDRAIESCVKFLQAVEANTPVEISDY